MLTSLRCATTVPSLLLGAAMLTTACAANSASSDAPRAAFAPAVVTAAAPPAATMDVRRAERTVESEPSRAPQERPGLGTEWGEKRESRIYDLAFERASPGRPFATAEIQYNDEQGVAALAAYHAGNGARRTREASVAGAAISIALDDDSGDALEFVRVGERPLVIGHAGQRYTIALTNHTAHRFEAVTTVDGLDVMNGRPGSIGNRGYILLPYATLEIDGFRDSDDTVAAFRFGRVSESYAAQTGTARNVGVIGVAFFEEDGDRWNPWTSEEVERRATASPFPADPRWIDPRYARPPGR